MRPPVKGTGHPNKILQTDFADPPDDNGDPQWIFRVETFVQVDSKKVDEVKRGLKFGADPEEAKSIANYLIGKVPGTDPFDAQRMIAAAFGMEFTRTSGVGKTADLRATDDVISPP